ncbi:MAG: hypothetical protein GY847_04205 [Proteobacteria bacterium]|nr:hypothetical protein [Pseudomonadota bacterium]
MSKQSDHLCCPHCGEALKNMTMPEELAWGERVQGVCFNDDCSYFKEGWDWMWEHYHVKTSYRYRVVNSSTGGASPLMVWSAAALRDHIIENNG